jgi:opacity protein-like surface antigen
MRAISIVLLLTFAAVGAVAQDHPKTELFGGYSFIRTEEESIDLTSRGAPVATARRSAGHLNGWNVAVTGNFKSWAGVVADFSGVYGSIDYDLSRLGSVPAHTSFHSFLFGPQFYFRGKNTTVFVRGMIGAVKLDQSVTLFGQNSGDDETAFAAGFGGGVDVRLSERISLRAFQADFILTRFDGQNIASDTQKIVRVSTGFVFRN